MRLDHVSYVAGPDGLAATVQGLGARVGEGFRDGGIHPRFGTRNFVLPLEGGTYVEVVDVLDHPAADRVPFGRAVASKKSRGGGWLAWVVEVDDLAPVARRLGRPPVPGSRHLPDGTVLSWHQIGVLDVIEHPSLPFFVHWDPGSPHPSGDPSPGLRLAGLQLSGDPDRARDWLGDPAADPFDGIAVDWVDAEEPGLLGVTLDTPRGPVRLD